MITATKYSLLVINLQNSARLVAHQQVFCTIVPVHVLSLSQPNSTTTFACLSSLPVSFFLYLLS